MDETAQRCRRIDAIRADAPVRALGDHVPDGDGFVDFFRARRLYKQLASLVDSGLCQSFEAPRGVRLRHVPQQVSERLLRNRGSYRYTVVGNARAIGGGNRNATHSGASFDREAGSQ